MLNVYSSLSRRLFHCSIICRQKSNDTKHQSLIDKNDNKTRLTDLLKRTTIDRKSAGVIDSQPNTNYRNTIGVSFPNRKGLQNYDPDIPISKLIENAPDLFRHEFTILKDTIRANLSLDRSHLIEQYGAMMDEEVHIAYTFKDSDSRNKWTTGCDSVWNEGYSTCQLLPTSTGTVLFTGEISSRIPKNGIVNRAGWASIKLNERNAFGRKKYFASRWTTFSHLLIKCRGDGRSYKMLLHTPGYFDTMWGDVYAAPLHTHGGPYWQYAKIPFSKFFLTVFGRVQDDQRPVCLTQVSAMGITLMDRIDGPFALEIDWIGVYNDRSHRETFAYESYKRPWKNIF